MVAVKIRHTIISWLSCCVALAAQADEPQPVVPSQLLETYVSSFNASDEELYTNIPNAEALKFLEANIPLFECPDKAIEQTYYFRWWTFRKHIKKTDDGYVITEFLPKVSWARKHNTINCPVGHHYYEGRWLKNPEFLDDYSVFWFRKGGEPRQYSCWLADSIWARHLVSPNEKLITDLLPDLVKNHGAWEQGWGKGKHRTGQHDNGLFYSVDDRDGMEMSIGGSGFRPTLNSYLYGDAKAIAAISRIAGDEEQAKAFDAKAADLKRRVQEKLWDKDAQFFKVLQPDGKTLADVRELIGYTPWYFNLPDAGHEQGWSQLTDPQAFKAPFGPTFAEQRHPDFKVSYEGHECQWNGPSWPLQTSITLTAMANVLNDYDQEVIGKKEYFDVLETYTKSHRRRKTDGSLVPWIDENLNPLNGDWISRTRLRTWKDGTWDPKKGGKERGKDYNHSSYNDLIITGLVGLRPQLDNTVVVNPLVPDDWDYFCLDRVAYHGHSLTILWDKTGEKYGRGKGLRVLADGKEIAQSDELAKVTGRLP